MTNLSLNPGQRKAIEHGNGPQLVIAGPGSGKTRVITQRIVHLLKTVPGIQPRNILALTFTDKATEEMQSRVQKALPELTSTPFISTFHAFCYHVLRRRHFERRLLDKVDVWIFLRLRMELLGLNFYQKLAEPGAFLHDLNDFFSRCQDELIEPDDFDAYVKKVEDDFVRRLPQLDSAELQTEQADVDKKKELAHVFRTSRKLIEDAGCSNLGSLIAETVRLWDHEPDVLEEYRSLYRFVLVDEFQDTNFGQVELLRRLAARGNNLTVVGDDDQAIYRFRGASHGAFSMFDRLYPRHATVFLNQNYRSTKRILRCAGTVISHNTHEIQKPVLKTENENGHKVHLIESPDYWSEASWIAGEVGRLIKRGMSPGDIAILYRAHNYRELLVEEFRRLGIPFAIRGLSILSASIVRDLVAYLRLVSSWHDNISMTRILLLPHWRFPESVAYAVRQKASQDRCSLADALESIEKASDQNLIAGTGWPELKKLLLDLRLCSKRISVTALFDMLTERLQLGLLTDHNDQAFLEAFQKFLDAWEQKSEARQLVEFMQYFGYFEEAGGKIEVPGPKRREGAVQMMTVHASKGLEFPIVFIQSVASRRFPSIERKPVIEFPEELRRGPKPPEGIHLQEERRLFFVAMTRAKSRLYVSSVARSSGNSKSAKKIPVFVENMLSNPVVEAQDIERIEAPQISPGNVSKAQERAIGKADLPTARQPGLFGAGDSGFVHPPLVEWSSQPSAGGLESAGGKLRLSATAVEAYLECPLKFKFTHLLKIPTGPQAALTFGNVMHRCVRHYFELKAKSNPEYEDLEGFYLASWQSVGFEDSYQEDSYKKAGLAQLRHFVEFQKGRKVPADRIKLEEHFAFEDGDIVLEGRIDQIDPLDSAGRARRADGQPVELIDYKTGRPRTQKEAEKSLQLSVYALAARRQMQLDPVRLTLHYLTNSQTVSTMRTQKDLDCALQQIHEVASQVRASQFDPTPGFVCKWCDFVPICPAHEQGM